MELALRLGLPGSGKVLKLGRSQTLRATFTGSRPRRSGWQADRGPAARELPIPTPRPYGAQSLACWMTTPSPPSPALMPMRQPPDLSYFNFAYAARRETRWSIASSIPYLGDSSTLPMRWNRESFGGTGHAEETVSGDSPTPAGNSVAAIALLRLYAFTNQKSYREQAEQMLEVAGRAGRESLGSLPRLMALRRCTSHIHTSRWSSLEKMIRRSSSMPSPPNSLRLARRCSNWHRTRRSRKICHPRWRRLCLICPRLYAGSRSGSGLFGIPAISLRSWIRNGCGEA